MKSNVTNIPAKKKGPHAPRAGGPLNLSEHNLLGFLIYFPDTDEFLYSHTAGPSHSSVYYTNEPCIAYCFASEQLAFKYSTFIDKPSNIVRLHDIGDKLAVRF